MTADDQTSRRPRNLLWGRLAARLERSGASEHGPGACGASPRPSARASHRCLVSQKWTRRLSATRGPAPMLKCTQPTSQAGQAAPRARRAHAIDYRHAANWPLYPYKQRYALGSSPAGRCARRTWQPSGTGTGVPGQRSRAHLLHGRCAHLSKVNHCCGRMPPR